MMSIYNSAVVTDLWLVVYPPLWQGISGRQYRSEDLCSIGVRPACEEQWGADYKKSSRFSVFASFTISL